MRKVITIVIALCLTGLAQAQEPRQPREVWNEVFTKREGREFPHNKFLAETIRGRKPGRALDIGMGEGRNALFLATQGWEVTGFDISEVGVQLARAAAQKKGLKVETASTGLADHILIRRRDQLKSKGGRCRTRPYRVSEIASGSESDAQSGDGTAILACHPRHHPTPTPLGLMPNYALQPTGASGLRVLAVPSSLRSSAAAEGERSAP